MMQFLRSFLTDTRGATAIEYGLVAALVAVGLLAGLTALGGSLENTFLTLRESIEPQD